MYRVHDKTDMDVDASDFQMTKSPITRHGDALADQSFQSFKSKEIRDSESPTHDIKFKSKALTDLSGWNVSTSLEVTPDGKGRTTESLMTTGGIQKLPDGMSEFAGKNQQITQAYHDGDDKNFISRKAESSNTHLHETVKTGDDNFNRTESKSVTTKFSSSQAVQHHQTVSNEFDDLLDSALPRRAINTSTRKHHEENIHSQNAIHDNQSIQQFENVEQRNQQTHHKQHHTDQATNQTIKTTNQTNQKQQVIRTLQEEAELLAAKPGTIIARTVEYPDPNTKVITETKSLPDGTTVTTRKYETKSASSKTFRSSSNQEQVHTSRTVVEDRAQRNRLEYQLTDGTTNVRESTTPQKHRTVHREITEQVCRDENLRRQPEKAPVPPKSTDTLDHEVEYIAVSPAQRPPKRTDNAPMRDTVDFIETERGCAMVDNRRPVPEKYTDSPDHASPYSRQVGTKTQVNKSVQEHRQVVESHSEHKEHREVKEIREETHGYPSARPTQPRDRKPDFSTHGFPSVREPSRDEPSSRPTSRQPSESRELRPDFSTHGFPSARAPSADEPSSRPTSRRPSDSREPKPDYTTHGFPSARQPGKDEPRSNYRQPSEPRETKPDFSTHGFPSVKSPTKRQPGGPGEAPRSPTDIAPHEPTVVRRTEETRRQSTDSTYQQETTTTKRVTKVTDHTTVEKTTPSYPAGKPSYTKPKDAEIRPVSTPEHHQPRSPEDVTKPSPAGVPSYQRPLNREPRQKDGSPAAQPAGKPSYTTTKTTETTHLESYEYPDHPDRPGFDEPRRDGSLPRGRPETGDFPDTGSPRHPDHTRTVPEDTNKMYPAGVPSYQKPLNREPKPKDEAPKTPPAGKPSYTTTKTTEVTRTETYRYPDHPGKPGYSEPGRDGSVPRDGSEPGDVPYHKSPRKPDYTTHGFPSARPQEDAPKQYPAGTPSYQRPLNRDPKPRDDVPRTPPAGKPSYTTTKTTEVTTYEYPDHPGKPGYREPGRDGSLPRDGSEPGDIPYDRSPRKPDYTIHGFPSARPHGDAPKQYPAGTPSYQRPLNREPRPRDDVPKTPTAGKPSYTTTKTTEMSTYEYPDHPDQPRYGQPRRDGSAPRSTPEPRQPDYTTHGFPSARPQRPVDDIPDEATKPYPAGTPSYQRPLNREPRPPTGKPSYTTTETTRTETYEYPDQPGKPRDSDEPRQPDYTTQGFPSAKPQKPSRTVHEPTDDASTPTSTRPGSPTYSTGRPTEDDVFAPDRRAPSDYRVPSFQPQPERPAGKPSYEKPKRVDETPDDYEIMKKLAQERRVVRKERTDVTTKKISVEVSATHEAFARSLRCISPADRDHGSVRSLRTSTSSVRSSTSPDKKTRRSPSEEKTTPQKTMRPTTPRSPTKNRPRSPDAPTDRYKSSETVDLTTTRIEQDELRKRGTRVVTQRTTPRDKPTEVSPGKTSRPSHKPTTPGSQDITPKKPNTTVVRRPSDRLTNRPHSNRPDEEGPTYYEPIERIPKTSDTSTTTKRTTSQTTHFTDVIQRRQTPKTPDSSKPQHPSKLEPSSPRGTRKVPQPTPDAPGVRKPSPQKSPERITRKPTDKLPRGTTYDVEPDSPRKTVQPTSPERTTKRVTEPKKPISKGTTYDIETCDYEPESPSQPRKPSGKSPTRPTMARGVTYDVDSPDQPTGRKPQQKKPGEVSPTRRTPHPSIPRGQTYDVESPDDTPVVRRPRPSAPTDESPERKSRPSTYTFDSDTEPIIPSDSSRPREPMDVKGRPKDFSPNKYPSSPYDRSPDRSGTTPIDSDYDSDRRPHSKSPSRPSTTPTQRYGQPQHPDRTTTIVDYETTTTTKRTDIKRVPGEEPDQPGKTRGKFPSGKTPEEQPEQPGRLPQKESPGEKGKQPKPGSRPTHPEDETIDLLVRRQNKDTKVTKDYNLTEKFITNEREVTTRRTDTKRQPGICPEEEPDQPGRPRGKSPSSRTPGESDKYPKEVRPGQKQPTRSSPDRLTRTDVTERRRTVDETTDYETTERADLKRIYKPQPGEEPDQPGRPRGKSPSGRTPREGSPDHVDQPSRPRGKSPSGRTPQGSSPDRTGKYPKEVRPGQKQPERSSPDRLTRTEVTERRSIVDETVDYETTKRTDVKRVYRPGTEEEPDQLGRPREKSPVGRTPQQSSPDRADKYPKDVKPGQKQPDRPSPDRLTRTDLTERRRTVDETLDYETTKRTDVKRVYKSQPGEEPDQPGQPRDKSPSGRTPQERSPDRVHYPDRPRGKSPTGRTPQETAPDRTEKYPKDIRPGQKQPDRPSPDRLTRTDVTERRTVDETVDYETTERTDIKRVYKPKPGEEPEQPGRPGGKSPSSRIPQKSSPRETSPDHTEKYPKDIRPGQKQPDRLSPDRLTRTDVTERSRIIDETVDYETTKRTDVKRVYKPQPGEEPDQPGRPRGKSPSGRTPQECSPDRFDEPGRRRGKSPSGRTPQESSPDRADKYPKDIRPGQTQPDRTDRLTRTDVTERRRTVDETVDYETIKRTDVKRVYKPQPGEEPDEPGRPRGKSPSGRVPHETSPDRTGKYPKEAKPGQKHPDRLTRTEVTERRSVVDETVDYDTTKRTDIKRVYKPGTEEEPDQPGKPRGKSPSGRTPQGSSPDRFEKYPKDTKPGQKQPDRSSPDRLTRTDVTERRRTVDETVDYETTERTDVKRVYRSQPGEEPDQPGQPRGKSPSRQSPKDTKPGAKQPDRLSPDRVTRRIVDETVDYETTRRTDVKRVHKPGTIEEPDEPGKPRGKSPTSKIPRGSSPDHTGKYPKDTRPGSKQPDGTSPDRLTRTDITERRRTVDETVDYETTKRTDVKRVYKPETEEEPDEPGRPRGKSPLSRTQQGTSPDRTDRYPDSKQPKPTSPDRSTRTGVTETRKTIVNIRENEFYSDEEPDQPGRPHKKSPQHSPDRRAPSGIPKARSPDRADRFPKDTDGSSPDRSTRTVLKETRKTVEETVDHEFSPEEEPDDVCKRPTRGPRPTQPEDRAMDILVRRQNKDTKGSRTFAITEDFITNERDVTAVRTDKVTRKSPTRPDDKTRTVVTEVRTKVTEEYSSKSPRSSPTKDLKSPSRTSPSEREPIDRSQPSRKIPEVSPERTTTSKPSKPSEKAPRDTSPYSKSPVPSRKSDKPRDAPAPYGKSPQPTRRSDKPVERDVSPQKSPDRKPYDRSPETVRKMSAPADRRQPHDYDTPSTDRRKPTDKKSPERRPDTYTRSPERKPGSQEPRRLSQPLQPEDLTIEVVLQKDGRDIQLSTTVDETRRTTTVRKSIDKSTTDERTVTGRKVVKKVPKTSDEEPDETEEIYEVPSDDEDKPREPFFLNQTKTETTEVSRVEKTKPRAPFTRSETYDERCRKMLGMGEPEESPKTRPSRYDKTTDFLHTEREVEEVTRKGEKVTRTTTTRSPQSPRKTSPVKSVEDSLKKRPQTIAPTTRSPAPSREISPTKKVTKEDVKKPATKQPTSPERQPYREPKLKDKPRAHSPVRSGEEPESDELEPDYCRPGTDRRPSYSTTAEIIIRDVRDRSVSPDKSTTKVRESVRRTKDEDHTTVTRRTSKTTTEAIYVDDEYYTEEPRKPKEKTTRTHLQPGSPRKPSSPERKDISRPDTNVTRTTKGSTTTREDTKTSKSTVTKSTIVKPSKDKLPSSQAPNDYRPKDTSPQRKPLSGTRKPKPIDQGDREPEIPSDEELIVTSTTKTTTSRTTKKLPVTERKDSAPVPPVSKRERPTQKMTRSTSDNVIKTTIARKPKPDTPVPSTRPSERSPLKVPVDKRPGEKTPSSKRPTKCMTTKTINLSPTTNLLTTEDLENVIIDIQQAKSSREPTPNKIVPTPVSQNIEAGTPRYPDTVQEPDEEPRRRPKVKNIPIFEEETNDFVGCHITEVDDHPDTVIETTTYITKIPREESPTRHLRTTTVDETTTDECLLSVHDKVNKFITTAEEVKKTRPSAPFRPSPRLEDVPDDDECLLSVNEKVTKFLTTAEEVSKPLRPESVKKVKRPDVNDIDEDLRTDECVLSVSEKVNKFTTSAQKLADSSPQKSPGLVAKITKQVYPRDKPREDTDEETPQPAYRPTSPQRSPGLVASIEKKRRQPEYPEEEPEDEGVPRRPKQTVAERYKPDKPKEIIRHTISPSVTVRNSVQKVKSVFEKEPTRERPKQRDISSRPSTFDGKRPKDVKLEDIGIQRSPEREVIEVTKTTITHRERSPVPDDSRKPKTPSKVHKITNDIVSSKKDLFEKRISSTKYETVETHPSTTVVSRQPSKTTPSGQKPSSITRIAEKFSTPNKPASQPTKSAPRTSKPTVEESSPSRRTKPIPSESPRRPANLSDIFKEPESTGYPKPAPRSGSHPESREDSPRRVTRPSTSPDRSLKPKSGQVEYIEEEYYSKRRTSRTDEEIVTREQTDSTRRIRNGDLSPSHRYMEHTVSSMEHRRDSDLLAPGLDRPYSPRDSLPRSSSPSPTRHFMEHTVSSFEHRRDSDLLSPTTTDYHCHPDDPRPTSKKPDSKFGVELKRTPLKDAKPRRKSSSSDIPHVEEIFDLELLEKMLETVVGYEQRRRIRAQIRVVKKMIETQEQTKRVTQVTKKVTESSPQRKPGVPSHITPRKSEVTDTSTVLYTGKPKEIIYIPTKTTTTMTSTRTEFRKVGKGPEKIVTTKKTVVPKEKTPKDEKPIWASKNILKKPSENDRVTKTSTVTKKTTGALTAKQRMTATTTTTSDEDCITSSYGIGPTDEDGKPLFGIRALKKKTTTSTTPKVTGKIITEKYYSENGAEPVGERTVVMYGTDTDDIDNLETTILDDDDNVERKVIKKGNVTTTITRKGNLPTSKDAKIVPEITETTSKVVRRGSVKEISEKFVRKESSSSLSEKTSTSYPKAGLILRTQTKTTTKSGSPGSRSSRPQSEEYEEVTDENAEVYSTTSSTRKQSKTSRHIITETESDSESMKESRVIIDGKETRSFLDSQGTKVTGVKDVIERMQNADYVVDDSDTTEDQEARSLLNKFLGASVLMSGVETMVPKEVTTTRITTSPLTKEQVTTTRVTKTIKSGSSSSPVVSKTCDIEEIVDEHILKQLLEESTNYEDRRRIRARLRQIMADREVCTTETTETKEKDGAVVTTKTKVTTRTVASTPKVTSPFALFKQLDKQNASPFSTPTQQAGKNNAAPIFKFTDPALSVRAATVKEQLLQWCQMKTKEYENVQITNFSTSWSDGLAFCALIHHFLPDAFDYSKLTPQQRRHNFELAFRVADEKAGIAPLLDVEDMVIMKRPDWKCVFTYVQTIYRRFHNSD